MYGDFFATRVNQLRVQKGVSARELSLAIGQSESYINKIENKKSFPSMDMFFCLCEYFDITPKDFFDDGVENPALIKSVITDLNTLSENKINNIYQIIKDVKSTDSTKKR